MDLLKEFEEFNQKLELSARPVSEADKLIVSEAEKEERWRRERAGKITSSTLPNLMKGGRGKGVEWGEVAKKTILEVIHERITGIIRSHITYAQMQWGIDHQAEAVDYYRRKYPDAKSCDTDFDDIMFVQRDDIPGFGDSPDVVQTEGDKITVTSEVKCPESGAVHLEYCGIKAIHEKTDYYWQMLGHLLAAEHAERLDFISYDPRFQDGHPLKMHIVSMYREDHADNLIKLWARISDANYIIDKAIKENDLSIVLNIDSVLGERG